MSFLPAPPHRHGSLPRTAVLLVNLGTPDAPTPAALRRYLKQFLWDPRVVEFPRPLWWLVLNGIILNVRPKKSAAKYASIWTENGSPLRWHSEQQMLLLRGYLGERGLDVDVRLAMRYGEPSIPSVLEQLHREGTERLLVLPMYPQYSATTTATSFDEANRWFARVRNVPELRTVKHFHDHPGYIAALARSVRDHWVRHGSPIAAGGKLVMSFHGIPKTYFDAGDPYHCECFKTARLVTEALGLRGEDVVVTFQSRLGRSEWLQPYTARTVQELARSGVARIDVLCPGFVADCLETLEEIDQEVREDFLSAGGREFHYIACLNESPAFIHALADVAQAHLSGWPVSRAERASREAQAAAGEAHARERGASV
jgi:protoporphyrin/coproporphyrin ferrochelatase